MGYTHYYDVRCWHAAEWQAAWPRLIKDVPLIIEAADVLIRGPYVEDGFSSPIANVEDGICFNGVSDDAHEDFCLSEQVCHRFVKTFEKPYDVAVACVLLRAYLLAPTQFDLSSDGSWDGMEWVRPRRLYRDLWPGEPILCPWSKVDVTKESNPEISEGEATLALSLCKNERPHVNYSRLYPHEITDSLKGAQLDSSLSPQLETIKFTVSGVDFTHISRWLSFCEDDRNHTECKASQIQWQNLPGTRFKVIDTHRRCIVEAPEGCSYIALTYVWGGVDQAELNASTAPLLMRDGGLDLAWPKLPTTIRDATVVCEQLGERYLWIDALCIMQDSSRDLKFQMLRMRQIYSAAKCTIAAVSAETAAIGLLGNLPAEPLRPSKECESEDTLNAMVESSPWSRRAWCYQEKVLSHRLILFTSNGIYMQCRAGSCDANGTQLQGKESQSVSKFNAVGSMLFIPPGKELESYISAVEHYSQRKLTRKDDKINAFQGVFRRYNGKMDGKTSSFCYGLPICAFDQLICWRTRRHNPHLRNQVFPSWSWLGWDDAVSFDRKMLQTARTSQMIYDPGVFSHKGVEDNLELRKPACHALTGPRFGFPAATGGNYYNNPERWLSGCMADLRIALDHIESDGSNSLYAVFPNRCSQSQQPSLPPERKITVFDLLSQPLPEIKWMDAETAAAPSVPAAKQTEEKEGSVFTEHDAHEGCEAHTPLGYIWLDTAWRRKQPDQCIMRFMALAGEKDPKRQGKWKITMLMCLQRMEKNGHYWADERVQVMDCEIDEESWMKMGAKVINFKLV
ncbi:uncharacterized protein A1O5_00130 [Cladophialophora psammophila CBS 110553]|uniref:Heterokaryon incompatibility domain-containing protein n=1 Tax=Cladophialophora psammophila CBS 110553 TaxID=1182543 RepID=W9X5W2_9EURO|nr:uncharacterized protein A1O5_00130 [Cladophialophora psammophila CBS 110553]EXJ75623.1 hypothetical protein A1O5_00130 [Cladophialophora psammophila CBS 110553]